MAYVEQEIISKSDYFSSTLDANCDDKEAALAATTAAYTLALVTKGKERVHYAVGLSPLFGNYSRLIELLLF